MSAAYVDIKGGLMRSLLLTNYELPYCHGSLDKHIRLTYPGSHRWGDAGRVLRLCPGTLAEGSLYDRLEEMCQEWCWLALCQSDVAQLRKCPIVLAVASPWAFFLINYY